MNIMIKRLYTIYSPRCQKVFETIYNFIFKKFLKTLLVIKYYHMIDWSIDRTAHNGK